MYRIAKDYTATTKEIQDVWALVTKQPLASVKGIAEQTDIDKTKVHHILKFLEAAGYIKHKFGCHGRTVVIPLQSS